jgi:transcriptional regulator
MESRMREDETRNEQLLPGTLEMLVLKTLSFGPLHGYGIAQNIQRLSGEALRVEEGSLYPALQRIQLKGWVKSKWKLTPTRRRARYYTLTAAGRRQLRIESSTFARVVSAIGRVMQAESA